MMYPCCLRMVFILNQLQPAFPQVCPEKLVSPEMLNIKSTAPHIAQYPCSPHQGGP